MRVYWQVSISLVDHPHLYRSIYKIYAMSFIQQFIEGMLTNLGTLPLDRIQTFLKFAPGYDRSIEQLALFMEAARREGLVVVRDGEWRLNK